MMWLPLAGILPLPVEALTLPDGTNASDASTTSPDVACTNASEAGEHTSTVTNIHFYLGRIVDQFKDSLSINAWHIPTWQSYDACFQVTEVSGPLVPQVGDVVYIWTYELAGVESSYVKVAPRRRLSLEDRVEARKVLYQLREAMMLDKAMYGPWSTGLPDDLPDGSLWEVATGSNVLRLEGVTCVVLHGVLRDANGEDSRSWTPKQVFVRRIYPLGTVPPDPRVIQDYAAFKEWRMWQVIRGKYVQVETLDGIQSKIPLLGPWSVTCWPVKQVTINDIECYVNVPWCVVEESIALR